MTGKYKPISKKNIKTYSIRERKSKVTTGDFAKVARPGSTMKKFLAGLPNILAAKDLNDIASRVVRAHRDKKTVMLGMGGHVIKTGLSPLIIDLMERGVVSSIAMNGSCIVHDFETAFAGQTSEDVDAELPGGAFGMAEETGRLLNDAIKKGRRKGIGRAVGETIARSKFPHRDKSILAAGVRLGVPVTVHVAIGADILHIHPQADGGATGEATLRDFDIFCSIVATLKEGAYINIGSAVILPEVFMKALTLVRNLGHDAAGFTTVNMDFIQHYRPLTNVVRRPTECNRSGRGFALTGHHEIMVPLLHAAIIEKLTGK
jgi:hypothetical protein